MERILEKEIMNNKAHIFAYASFIKDSPLSQYITNYIVNKYPLENARIIDLGSGTADIPINLIQKRPQIKEIIGIDASQEMIAFSGKKIQALGLSKKIKLINAKIPDTEEKIPKRNFDIIFSKHLLHHLPDPCLFWEEIKKLTRKNSKILITDFIRPSNEQEIENIVTTSRVTEASTSLEKFAEKEFYNSLRASFTLEEIRDQLRTTKMRLKISKFKDYIFIAEN